MAIPLCDIHSGPAPPDTVKAALTPATKVVIAVARRLRRRGLIAPLTP